MDDLGDSKLNPSSLIDLKAELHKKYEAFRAAKLAKSTDPVKRTKFRSKLDVPKEKKEKTIKIDKSQDEIEEESLALKKSRLALEAKAKLYNKIVTNGILIDDEQNESYLVDFQRKVLYEPSESKDIVQEPISHTEKASTSSSYKHTEFNYDVEDKITRDSHKTKAEATEPGTSTDQPIHYQNVQFNEVRDHGTGYFAFSQDHEKRKEQMEELNSLRKETENKRASKQRLLDKRKAMLQARLAKICERKNIDPSVLEAYKTKREESEDVPEPVAADLSSIPLPEVVEEPMKKPKIRPWDEGKDNLQHFVPEKKKTKTQSDWIKEIREERRSEFAPPSTYLYDR
ncbi:hypothetical protein JTE90_020818 [Oedothorax gibbosus]|uniref:Coiled-coil domain-containing protein 174 n=1 Tax=Oedothorax gibbosus TaxID=931172 RepID=A0AAV6U6M3_9ARAC|nr:hypothetical protein JTE90_020818 [Oedothorax gibbosus]